MQKKRSELYVASIHCVREMIEHHSIRGSLTPSPIHGEVSYEINARLFPHDDSKIVCMDGATNIDLIKVILDPHREIWTAIRGDVPDDIVQSILAACRFREANRD